MTSYLVNHQKKKRVLAKREQKLRKLLNSEADDDKTSAAAEEVREAMIRVFRVKRSLIPTRSGEDARLLAKVDRQISEWKSLSMKEIIGLYRNAA